MEQGNWKAICMVTRCTVIRTTYLQVFKQPLSGCGVVLNGSVLPGEH